MMTIEILGCEILGCGLGEHTLLGVWRMTPQDERRHVANIFTDGEWQMYPGTPWTAEFGTNQSSWSCLFQFLDGTRGVCRVVDLNDALASLGYFIDRRGDARD